MLLLIKENEWISYRYLNKDTHTSEHSYCIYNHLQQFACFHSSKGENCTENRSLYIRCYDPTLENQFDRELIHSRPPPTFPLPFHHRKILKHTVIIIDVHIAIVIFCLFRAWGRGSYRSEVFNVVSSIIVCWLILFFIPSLHLFVFALAAFRPVGRGTETNLGELSLKWLIISIQNTRSNLELNCYAKLWLQHDFYNSDTTF